MKNRSRSATIALSVLTIVCSLSLLIGATFALFTDRQDNDVSFSSGDVKFEADLTVTDVWATDNTAEPGTEKGTVGEDGLSATYPGEGSVTIVPKESGDAFSVEMKNVAQGETARFSLSVRNTGSVKMKYLAYLEARNEEELKLLQTLEVKAGENVIALDGSRKVLQTWTTVSSKEPNNTSEIENIEIKLPWNVDPVAGTLNFGIEAVQYNAATETEVNGKPVGSLEDAFEAIENDVTTDTFEVTVGTGAQSIPAADLSGKNVKLIGANGAENTVLNGDYNVSSGSVAMEDVTFNGDITGSGSVTLTNVTLNGSVNIGTVTTFSRSRAAAETAVTLENVKMNVETVDKSAIVVSGCALNMKNVELTFKSLVTGAAGDVKAVQVKEYAGTSVIENTVINASTTNTDACTKNIIALFAADTTVNIINSKLSAKSTYTNSDGYGDFYSMAVSSLRSDINAVNSALSGAAGAFIYTSSLKHDPTEYETPTFTMTGGEINAIYYGVTGNHDQGAGNIVLENVKVTASDPEEGVAIYRPMGGKTTITGSTLKSHTVIEAKLGEFVIENSTLTATGAFKENFVANKGGANGNGSPILFNGGIKAYVTDYEDDRAVTLTLKDNVVLNTTDEKAPQISYYDWGEVEQPFTFVGTEGYDMGVFATNGVSLRRLLENKAYGVVKLNNDIKYEDVNLVSSDVNAVLDLNGRTISAVYKSTTALENGAVLTIKNGTFNAELAADKNNTNTTVIMNAASGSRLTIDNVKFTTKNNSGFGVDGKAVLTVKNSTVTANVYCVATNATTKDGVAINSGVTINLEKSVFIAQNETNDNCAICLNVEGALNMTDCTVKSGRQAVLVRGGTANISGGTIETTGEYQNGSYLDDVWGGGNEVPLAALVIGNRSTSAYAYPATVALTGVEIVAGNGAPAIYMYGNKEEHPANLTCDKETAERVTVGGGYVFVNGEQKSPQA